MWRLFQPDWSVTVGAISLIIGLVGLLISVGGFALTIRQIAQAKSKADVVKDAVLRLEKRASLYDVTKELERASTAIQSAAKFARREYWEETYEHCESARTSIHNCIISQNSFSYEDFGAIEQCHEYISGLMSHLSRAKAGKRKPPDPANTCENLNSRVESLKAAQRAFATDIKL